MARETPEMLRSWIGRQSPLPVQRAVEIARRVAEAVERLHVEGRVAGSALDPARIEVLPGAGELAVLLPSPDSDASTSPSEPAEDIARIGAILYEALAGVAPPARRAPPPVTRARADVPEPVASLIQELFRRPPAVSEVVRQLRALEFGRPIADPEDTGRTRRIVLPPAIPPPLTRPDPSSGAISAIPPVPTAPPPPLPVAAPAPRDVRPLEDRTLDLEGLEAVAAAGAPRERWKLAAAIVALVIAAAVLGLAIRSAIRTRPPIPTATAPAPTRVAAAPTAVPTPFPVVEVSPPSRPPSVGIAAASPPPLAATGAPVPAVAAAGSVTPSVPDRADAERLREALDAWIESTNAHDISGHMLLYMPRLVTFNRQRGVSREVVWSEKSRLFGDFTDVRASQPNVRFGADGRSATTTFRKRFLLRGRPGESEERLDWVRTARGWRISGERDGPP